MLSYIKGKRDLIDFLDALEDQAHVIEAIQRCGLEIQNSSKWQNISRTVKSLWMLPVDFAIKCAISRPINFLQAYPKGTAPTSPDPVDLQTLSSLADEILVDIQVMSYVSVQNLPDLAIVSN